MGISRIRPVARRLGGLLPGANGAGAPYLRFTPWSRSRRPRNGWRRRVPAA